MVTGGSPRPAQRSGARRPLKLLLGIALALVLALGVGVGLYVATSGVDTPRGEESRALLADGPWEVATRDHTFVDRSRPTASNGEYAGADERTLVSTLWYPSQRSDRPAAEERPAAGFPLIVYSHGFMSTRSEGTYLAEHFASHGYLFVAADYPLTHFSAPGGPRFDDVVHQPGDVSFLIDRLLAWSDDATHDFAGAVDPDRIGVMGLSLGGMTSTLAAFHPRLRDPRLAAAVSIAGPSALFLPAFFQTTDIPFLMIAADADAIVGYEENSASLLERAPRAGLVTLHGASHAGFAEIARLLFRWVDNPDALGCRALMDQLPLEGAPREEVAGLGGVDEGVDQSRGSRPCQELPTARAMRPARQHMLTLLAAFAFFESQFAEDEETRRKAARYLSSTLAAENDDVTVELALPSLPSS